MGDPRKFAIGMIITSSMLLLSMTLLFIATLEKGVFFNVFFAAAAVFWVFMISRFAKELRLANAKR